MANREFDVEIPAHLTGQAADDAVVEAFADSMAKKTNDEVLKALGL